MDEYESTILRDVSMYHCEYGRLPSAIMMSTALLAIIIRYCGPVLCYNTLDGITHMFHGIEIKPYHSDKLEYHLVSSSRELT
jgi:hypothetical protein